MLSQISNVEYDQLGIQLYMFRVLPQDHRLPIISHCPLLFSVSPSSCPLEFSFMIKVCLCELRLTPRATTTLCSALFLPARDPVLKDQVLNGNITHSKHGHVTRKKDPVLNGECSPFKTGSFFLVTWPCFEWVMLQFKTWSFKTGSCAGRMHGKSKQLMSPGGDQQGPRA